MKIKKLEFETRKGKFLIVENNLSILIQILHYLYQRIGLLSGLTEEQASEIVDSLTWNFTNGTSGKSYRNYLAKSEFDFQPVVPTALESLHSLIKSKGWFTSNPIQSTKPPDDLRFYDNQEDMEKCITDWHEAESRTLHNTVVFKIASDKV